VLDPRFEDGTRQEPVNIGSPNWDEAMANADLIAAAPELLAVAEMLVRLWDCGRVELDLEEDEQLRAAIAKARGEG